MQQEGLLVELTSFGTGTGSSYARIGVSRVMLCKLAGQQQIKSLEGETNLYPHIAEFDGDGTDVMWY